MNILIDLWLEKDYPAARKHLERIDIYFKDDYSMDFVSEAVAGTIKNKLEQTIK